MNSANLTIYEFTKMVIHELEERMGDEYVIQDHDVMKNNNVVLKGITIRKKTKNLAPTIYLKNYYTSYLEGESLQSILSKILQIYEDNSDMYITEDNMHFKNLKNKIRFKIINAEKNLEFAKHHPVMSFLDLFVSFYVDFDVFQDSDTVSTIQITNEMINLWGISISELYDIALENTDIANNYVLIPLLDVVRSLMELEGITSDTCLDVYVCTNSKRMYGACVMTDMNLLNKVACDINDSFYIIPSSIHEVLIMPKRFAEYPESFRSMVHEVNSTAVLESEILSDSVYYFDRDSNKLQIA